MLFSFFLLQSHTYEAKWVYDQSLECLIPMPNKSECGSANIYYETHECKVLRCIQLLNLWLWLHFYCILNRSVGIVRHDPFRWCETRITIMHSPADHHRSVFLFLTFPIFRPYSHPTLLFFMCRNPQSLGSLGSLSLCSVLIVCWTLCCHAFHVSQMSLLEQNSHLSP